MNEIDNALDADMYMEQAYRLGTQIAQQMKDAGVDVEHPGFKYFLQAFKYGMPPHGGCGFGIDRLVEKVCGLSNVKEATLFPRDTKRLAP